MAFSTQNSSKGGGTPDSDVSPLTQPQPMRKRDYFSVKRWSTGTSSSRLPFGARPAPPAPADSQGPISLPAANVVKEASAAGETAQPWRSTSISFATAAPSAATNSPEGSSPDEQSGSSGVSPGCDEDGGSVTRKSSSASVIFLPPVDSRHQGKPKRRLRGASPSPERFRRHVGFDNIPVGEATKFNTLSYTISISHVGYQPGRQSRTLMVGVDQHSYSDNALQWLIEEYADDGDEIICVHVVEKDPRVVEEKNYKEKAHAIEERIKKKIPPYCAVSVKLEYAVGKLHDTFQQLIQVYQPSMLIVGTRGRSLGGLQGLVNTRNSFSKYCLQYSPIPVVVVRDHEKRQKKKDKRSHDPSRQSYLSMLAPNQGVHEADSEGSSTYGIEVPLSADEEAHKVAAAIGLPAAFDPTLKPIDLSLLPGPPRYSAPPILAPAPQLAPALSVKPAPAAAATSPLASPASLEPPEPVLAPSPLSNDSEESEGSGSEDEFEVVVAGGRASRHQQGGVKDEGLESEQKKEKLHKMEVGEAAALLGQQVSVEDDENENENEDEDEDPNDAGDEAERGDDDENGKEDVKDSDEAARDTE